MGFFIGVIVVVLIFAVLQRMLLQASVAGGAVTAQVLYDCLSPEAQQQVDAAAAKRAALTAAAKAEALHQDRRRMIGIALILGCVLAGWLLLGGN